MSYINTQASSSYIDALQATEGIEAPALGFCRPGDCKGPVTSSTALNKQGNTQIQLLVQIQEKVLALEERIKKLEAKGSLTNIPDEVIQKLTKKVQLRLAMQERASIVPVEVLYHSRQDDIHHRVYVHCSEEAMLVTTNQVDRAFIQQESYDRLQRSVLIRGYENWRNGEANLLITKGMVGRLSNTPNVGFAYLVENVVEYLTTHGVRALPGRHNSTSSIIGQNWIIQQSTVNIPMQLTEVNTRNLLDGRISIRYAIVIKESYTIPPHGRILSSTGIYMAVPEGTYGGIAPRSGVAWMHEIHIGVGIIDSDYRGPRACFCSAYLFVVSGHRPTPELVSFFQHLKYRARQLVEDDQKAVVELGYYFPHHLPYSRSNFDFLYKNVHQLYQLKCYITLDEMTSTIESMFTAQKKRFLLQQTKLIEPLFNRKAMIDYKEVKAISNATGKPIAVRRLDPARCRPAQAKPKRRCICWNIVQKKLRKATATYAMKIGDAVAGPSGKNQRRLRIASYPKAVHYQSQ
ncbi:hypothetical protein ZIOFF_028323 [Zingiber officinale]|uniref:dUTP diphosphatase n=1 Tax=Zingiber officinale TaxID=94328 RepID=A0A8J5LEU6_ZINOF|nr:hypothetical protein ZIOFF_028323 [Zingiber officinale]